MANPEHVTWLREGVAKWNERRLRQPFDADLTSVNLWQELGGHIPEDVLLVSVNLADVDFSAADLSESRLGNTNLKRAEFVGTRLHRTRLVGSDLTECYANGADFTGAELHWTKAEGGRFYDCDFSAAQFVGANLKEADFFGCTLDEAHLYDADIAGVNLMLSRPWTARLFPPSDQRQSSSVVSGSREVRTITDLLERSRELKETYGEQFTLYFRGESRSSWNLSPSVMRSPDNRELPLRSAEATLLKELMTRQPGAFSDVPSALAQWVFAQHHGLPTRLLDVTRNPLVALFNACETDTSKTTKPDNGRLHVFAVPGSLIKSFDSDSVKIVMNFAKLPRAEQNLLLGKNGTDATCDAFPYRPHDVGPTREAFCRAKARLYFNIRQESPFFEEKIDWRDLFRVFVVEPQQMFERLKAQSGAFLLSAFHERFERDEVLKWNEDIPIYVHHTLAVPRASKLSILEELRLLNVTPEVLMPSVDASARAVMQQYRNRMDTV